ncbi:MAG TPA: nitroreductase family protein, partial [Isosphaeraceae bacterium]|nr:nitroreductase family protein [Isosphaeraceae bacterium]
RRNRSAEYVRSILEGMTREEREAYGVSQSNIALGYLLLGLESLGFGSSPMLGFDPVKLKELLGLPEHVQIPAIVAVGRPGEADHKQHRLPLDEITSFA